MTDNIEKFIQAGVEFYNAVEIARQYGLKLRMSDCIWDDDVLRQAFSLLENDTTLSSHFSEGTKAQPPFTPREVLILAGCELPKPSTANLYMELTQDIRNRIGRYPPRPCRKGLCNNYALSYPDDASCYKHSTQGAVEKNREMKQLEKQLIKEEVGY